ncbi:MAG: ABC transporter ATP-binding protein [Candidatus Bathyarchaeia archaeon]
MSETPLLYAENLVKYFPVRGGLLLRVRGYVKAVDDVSFRVNPQETYGIVGESGSGKTTLARSVLRLIEPTRGKIFFEGSDVTKIQGEALKEFRRNAQIIFQNPYSALHPRMMIRDIVGEPLKVHYKMKNEELIDKVVETLRHVGLDEEHMYRYPHEFSGGQRQRIVIARAIILRPKLLILDEPTSALDVSVQAKILNLLRDLQREFKLTYILISHHFAIIDYMCDRIAVMYLGKIIEEAPKKELFENPLHPYTKALISAIPVPDPKKKTNPILLEGEIPSPVNPPLGCRFITRCIFRKAECGKVSPVLEEVEKGHFVACPFWKSL